MIFVAVVDLADQCVCVLEYESDRHASQYRAPLSIRVFVPKSYACNQIQ